MDVGTDGEPEPIFYLFLSSTRSPILSPRISSGTGATGGTGPILLQGLKTSEVGTRPVTFSPSQPRPTAGGRTPVPSSHQPATVATAPTRPDPPLAPGPPRTNAGAPSTGSAYSTPPDLPPVEGTSRPGGPAHPAPPPPRSPARWRKRRLEVDGASEARRPASPLTWEGARGAPTHDAGQGLCGRANVGRGSDAPGAHGGVQTSAEDRGPWLGARGPPSLWPKAPGVGHTEGRDPHLRRTRRVQSVPAAAVTAPRPRPRGPRLHPRGGLLGPTQVSRAHGVPTPRPVARVSSRPSTPAPRRSEKERSGGSGKRRLVPSLSPSTSPTRPRGLEPGVLLRPEWSRAETGASGTDRFKGEDGPFRGGGRVKGL